MTDAARDGITVDLDLMGGAPRWAQGPGRPAGNSNPNWEPSAAAFGEFVQAIATRYSGSYDPALGRTVPGGAGDLPRVGFWSIWNEPNYGPSLAPQGVPGNLGVENSPRMYRQMLDAAWAAVVGYGPRSGYRHDPDRRACAPGREPVGRVLGDEAAGVPARAVLR